ncbi:cupin domain containing protein [Nitzschia inconspicua]|uniref:Cupin domain containing protein n=1 Tax=Nitzschia inconspicua TaxID=303405 RepID=A0A9K3KDW2_9STRA|nr:cupin domain containing protein [Nitzschia inconspicua]
MVALTVSTRNERGFQQLMTRYGPIIVSFLCGWLFGRHHERNPATTNVRTVTAPRASPTAKLPSFVKHLADVKLRNTAHVNPDDGRPITKHQLLDPFVVPNVAGISVATIQEGQEVTLHSHMTMHEFFFVLEGSAIFTIEDEYGTQQHKHDVRPGSFAYFAPPDRHGIQVAADSPDGDLKVLGWRHPIATFLVHYGVVAGTMIMIHDAMTTNSRDRIDDRQCQTSSEALKQRQQSVAMFFFNYFWLYFLWRLVLQWKKNAAVVFAEFYRQTFLCSVTIIMAALGFYTERPLLAEAFCLAVGIDQLLWYVDFLAYISWGTFPIGVTKYLFWPGTTWASRITSSHHFWTIPLVMWATGGWHIEALPISMVAVTVNVILSWYMTPISICLKDEKDENIYLNLNMAHEDLTARQKQEK